MLNGTYTYRFICGPTPAKVNVTFHAFHENGLASVAEISWTGSRSDWSLFREFHRSHLFGFNPETKTWKFRGAEALYYTITEGNPEKDGFYLQELKDEKRKFWNVTFAERKSSVVVMNAMTTAGAMLTQILCL